MKKSLISLILILFAASAFADTKSVIVELKQEPAAVAAARTPMTDAQIESYRASLRAAQASFLASLRDRGVAYEVHGVTITNSAGNPVRFDFTYTLVYNGVALNVDSGAVATIAAMPEVKAVHDNEILYTSSNISVPYIRAPEVYGAIKELTRGDNANEGLEGQGINISVIDTGIEWHHEQFGGDPTPPRLGIDPVNADVPTNEKVIYSIPLTSPSSSDMYAHDGFGHGTHVAATAAGYLGIAPGADLAPGTADDVRVHGVAPQAKLLSYKVCSDIRSTIGQVVNLLGGCETAAIIGAIDDSVSPVTKNGFPKPVAHVINMSLGGSGNPNSPTAVASDNASLRGAVVVAAAGNSGPGASTVGAPCVGRRVVCVANSIDWSGAFSADVLDPSSIDRNATGAVTPASGFSAAAGQRTSMTYYPMAGTPAPPKDSLAQYYVFVLGGELLVNWPTSARGRIALVQGSGTFAQIANNGFAAGAVAVLLRSDIPNGTAVISPIPGGNLPPADFDYLKTLITGATNPPNGALSTFPIRLNPFFGTGLNSTSSRGPGASYEQVKPDVTGPGTNILAACPPASLLGALSQGRYCSISGTSMASPHVAGAAALIRQAHPDWTPEMVRTALANTATNLRTFAGAPKPDPAPERVMDQGAGLIDVVEGVGAKALMGVVSSTAGLIGSHTFGDVSVAGTETATTRSVEVTIRDLSGVSGTYALSVVNNRFADLAGVTVTVSPSEVNVPANGTATYTVTVSIDGRLGLDTTSGPLHVEWYVKAARNDGTETLRMPFHIRAPRHAAPVMTLSDDATPDQENGVDRDGNYNLSWTYADGAIQPCGFRIEEAGVTAGAQIYLDNAQELMVNGSNSQWLGASNWNSRPHPVTGSIGYSPLYVDLQNAALTKRTAIPLPGDARIILTFDSWEDLEPTFDFVHVEISAGGGVFQTLGSFSGLFSGVRRFDISNYAGKSVLLRFRLVSDLGVSTPVHQGWVIDNIRVSASEGFKPVALVAADARSYDVVGHADGTFFTRVSSVYGNCAAPSLTVPSNAAEITVNALRDPTAAFTASPNPSHATQSVQFDASASTDNDSEGGLPGIVRYDWSFGDGSTETTTSPTTSHAYTAAGTYRVLLTVTDNDGQSASSESSQTVSDANASISGGGWIVVSGRKAMFSVDISMVAGVPSGSASYNDKVSNVKMQSTRITRVLRNGSTATIEGECTVNKSRSTTFTMTVTDNPDTMSITIDDYSASGPVQGGGVTVQ